MWIVHRQCESCGRKFSFPAPPIVRSLCNECTYQNEFRTPGPMIDNKLGIQSGPQRCEGDDIEALERTQCRGWAESDLEHAHHLTIENGEQ